VNHLINLKSLAACLLFMTNSVLDTFYVLRRRKRIFGRNAALSSVGTEIQRKRNEKKSFAKERSIDCAKKNLHLMVSFARTVSDLLHLAFFVPKIQSRHFSNSSLLLPIRFARD